MDANLHKTITVSRGLVYSYYFSFPDKAKPVTILFLHGFPSSSYDWHKQTTYFQSLGYGILVPDLLGAGGTAKPLDPHQYRLNAMSADILDILDAEGIQQVVGVAHDWGSVLLSRLSVLRPDRFRAYGWIGLAFMEPNTAPFDLEAAMVLTKEIFGYEGYAYWEFFTRPDAHEIIQENVDSFIQLVYPNNPDDWLQYMTLRGGTAKCIEGNVKLGQAWYMSDEEYQNVRTEIVQIGVRSPLNWYISQLNNVDLEDSKAIAKEQWKLDAPSFVVLAMRDYIARPFLAKTSMAKAARHVEYLEVEAGHWPQLAFADKVNDALHRWLQGLVLSS